MASATSSDPLAAGGPPFVTGRRLRALVVAQSPALRAGLRDLLDRSGIEVVGDTAAEDVDILDAGLGPADVLVVDVGDETPELLDTLALPAVALVDDLATIDGGPADHAPRAYLHREVSGEALSAAVRAVAEGLQVLDPALGSDALGAGVDGRSEDGPLTPRELDVLRLVSVGLPNKGIALELGISEHTVKFHVGSILGKLSAASRTEAVMDAARRGLLPL